MSEVLNQKLTYAVTGAGGLLGTALCQTLAKAGHNVVAILRSNAPAEFNQFPTINVLKGDVEDAPFLVKALKGVDGVFHAAGYTKPWAPDAAKFYNVNEHGTQKVCDACIANGVKRLVYTSSAGTHGAQQSAAQLIDEDTWPKEYHTDYEQSKYNGRQVALSYQEKGLEVVVVSPARVYGPGAPLESNVPVRILEMYVKNKFGFVPTDGKGVGSYVFIDDVVHGHILAMTKAPSGEEYLLGGDNKSYLECYEIMARITGKKYPVIKIPYRLSLAIGKLQLFMAENFGLKPTITTPWVRRYLKDWGISHEKIAGLGYTPHSLEEGLRKVWEAREKS